MTTTRLPWASLRHGYRVAGRARAVRTRTARAMNARTATQMATDGSASSTVAPSSVCARRGRLLTNAQTVTADTTSTGKATLHPHRQSLRAAANLSSEEAAEEPRGTLEARTRRTNSEGPGRTGRGG
jgi:hypothetical protein